MRHQSTLQAVPSGRFWWGDCVGDLEKDLGVRDTSLFWEENGLINVLVPSFLEENEAELLLHFLTENMSYKCIKDSCKKYETTRKRDNLLNRKPKNPDYKMKYRLMK